MFSEENSPYHVRVITTHSDEKSANEFLDFLHNGHVKDFLTRVPGVMPDAYVVRSELLQPPAVQLEIHYQFESKKAFLDYSASLLAEEMRSQVKPFADKGVTISRTSGLADLISKD